jgi:hypothetical protein
MSKLAGALAPFLFLLHAGLARAAEQGEVPMETANGGVIALFFLVVVACFAAYGWMTWKGNKKNAEKKAD